MNRFLVIRGGAIGDFILTLPAINAIREAYPQARIEILGYKHIAALAENRFYADAVRSIEYGPLSGFFARGSELNPELRDYFGGFDLILSYLYDPDLIFESNLRRCGANEIMTGPGKIDNRSHAVRQLAQPIEELGLTVEQFTPRIYPSAEDRQFAEEFLRDLPGPVVSIHPGSGSEAKNWPIENWMELLDGLLGSTSIVVIAGEADDVQLRKLESKWTANPRLKLAKSLSLPQLGGLLEKSMFVGHDSGISHLAAAVGGNCLLLFGPTDPAIWAPLNEGVRVMRAPDGDLGKLDVDLVRSEIAAITR